MTRGCGTSLRRAAGAAVCIAAAVLAGCSREPSPEALQAQGRELWPFVERYCVECHNETDLAGEIVFLPSVELVPADAVDGAVLRRRHQPGAGILRHTVFGPLLERGHQRVLRQLLGDADVAHETREPRDQPRRLDPPDRVDGAM